MAGEVSWPGEWGWVLPGVVVIGGLCLLLIRRASRRGPVTAGGSLAQNERHIALLEHADCLLWEAEVTEAGGAWRWLFKLQPSGLFRRIFKNQAPPSPDCLWGVFEMPDKTDMDRCSLSALREGKPGYEHRFRVIDGGGVIWLHESVSITKGRDGRFKLVGLVTEITAQQEAEQARRASEEQLQQLMAHANCMLWQAHVTRDEQDNFMWEWFVPKSELYRRMVGEDPNIKPIMPWGKMSVPEYDEIEARSRHAMRHNLPGYEQEFRVVKGEEILWMHEQTSITPLGKNHWKLEGVVIDITTQRRAEEAQRKSETRLQQLLERADCTIFQGRVTQLPERELEWSIFIPPSRLYRRIYGKDPEGMAGFKWREIGVPEIEEMRRTSRAALFGGAPGYEQRFHVPKPEGDIWLSEQVSLTPAGAGQWDLVGIITDITARHEAEEARRTSEAQLLQVLELADCMVWHATVEQGPAGALNWRMSTPRSVLYRRIFGEQPAEKPFGWYGLNVPGAAEMDRRAEQAIKGGAPGYEQLFSVIKPTGVIWLHEDVTISRTDQGNFRLVGVITDVSARREAEIALAAEKERLAVTLRAMTECVITADMAGCVQYMNPAARALTGWDDDAQGRPLHLICQFENSRTGVSVAVPIEQFAHGGGAIDLPAQAQLRTRKGDCRLVQGCYTPIHGADSQRAGMVLVFRDVTEQERLEQEIVRATRLESVGILAGGIAHDFNNILTAVMGNLAMAVHDVTAGKAVGERLRAAEKATLRARDLTQQLLTFAKGGDPVRSAVQLDAVLRDTTAFALLGSSVKAVFDLPDDLWPADADKGQIGRVVQNLVINAVQAMPRGGTLQVSAGNELIAGSSHPGLAAGHYVRIAISDTGEGILPEHLPRIFDPYFTTKETGSGLGLAAVYSIVRKHEGHIAVESQPGQGATFRLWLPALRRPAAPPREELPLEQVALKGRVLFMDDEEIIREMAGMLLQQIGFEVVCAVDGAQAEEKFRDAQAEHRPFALVIMDLTVPGGIGGREAISRLRAIDPQVKAIVSSGYSSDPVMANYRAHGFNGMVAKPYRVEDFVRVLREVMAESPARPAGGA